MKGASRRWRRIFLARRRSPLLSFGTCSTSVSNFVELRPTYCTPTNFSYHSSASTQLLASTLTPPCERKTFSLRLERLVSGAYSWNPSKHINNPWIRHFIQNMTPVTPAHEVKHLCVKTSAQIFCWKSKILIRIAVSSLIEAEELLKHISSSLDQVQDNDLTQYTAVLWLASQHKRTSSVFLGYFSLCGHIQWKDGSYALRWFWNQ